MNLIDVANHAGVSKSTVSRVLNNKANVASDTARVVKRAVEELGYEVPLARRRGRPSKAASGLRTGTIAFFIPESAENALTTPLSAALAEGIESALYEHNLSMIMAHLRHPDELPPCFGRRQIDGTLVRGGAMSEQIIEKLEGFPCVWLFEPKNPNLAFDVVMPDNSSVGALAAEYFLGNDCRQLVCVNTAPNQAAQDRQAQAFEQHARASGANARVISASDASDAIKQCVDIEDGDGIFVTGAGAILAGVYRELARTGRNPVSGIKLVCCTQDRERLGLIDSRIPSISIEPMELGSSAVEQLLWRLSHPDNPPRRLMVTPQLLVP